MATRWTGNDLSVSNLGTKNNGTAKSTYAGSSALKQNVTLTKKQKTSNKTTGKTAVSTTPLAQKAREELESAGLIASSNPGLVKSSNANKIINAARNSNITISKTGLPTRKASTSTSNGNGTNFDLNSLSNIKDTKLRNQTKNAILKYQATAGQAESTSALAKQVGKDASYIGKNFLGGVWQGAEGVKDSALSKLANTQLNQTMKYTGLSQADAEKYLDMADKETVGTANESWRNVAARHLANSDAANWLNKVEENSTGVSKAGKAVSGLARTVGNSTGAVAAGAAVGALTGSPLIGSIAGAALGASSAGGQSAQQAYMEKGNLTNAINYGLTEEVKEFLIEMVSGGAEGTGEGLVDSLAKNAVSKLGLDTGTDVVSKVLTNKLVKAAANAAGESVEEVASTVISPYLQRLTYDPEAKNASASDIANAAITAALVSGVFQGTQAVGNKAVQAVQNARSSATTAPTIQDITEGTPTLEAQQMERAENAQSTLALPAAVTENVEAAQETGTGAVPTVRTVTQEQTSQAAQEAQQTARQAALMNITDTEPSTRTAPRTPEGLSYQQRQRLADRGQQMVEEMDANNNTASTGETARTGNVSVVQQLKNAVPQLQEMEQVAKVTGNEIPKSGKLVDRLVAFAQSFGNKVDRPGFGSVFFTRKKIKSSMIGHGAGDAKIETFAAVPAVIQNGQQIGHEQNWKGRTYDTYLFAAPVDYRGKQTYLGAVVTKDAQDGRYYLHEVVDENGNVIFENKEATGDAPDTLATLTGALDSVANPVASADSSVAQQAQNVNGEVGDEANNGRESADNEAYNAYEPTVTENVEAAQSNQSSLEQNTQQSREPLSPMEEYELTHGTAIGASERLGGNDYAPTQDNAARAGITDEDVQDMGGWEDTEHRVQHWSETRTRGQNDIQAALAAGEAEGDRLKYVREDMEYLKGLDAWGTGDTAYADEIRKELRNQARQSHDWTEFASWVKEFKSKSTEAGQVLNVYRMISDSDRVMQRAGEKIDEAQHQKGKRKLSDEDANRLMDDTNQFLDELENIPDNPPDNSSYADVILQTARRRRTISQKEDTTLEGMIRQALNSMTAEEAREKTVASILSMTDDTINPSIGKRLRSYQVLSHLSSATTIGRNILGNGAFQWIDGLSVNGQAAAIDWLISGATGTRSTAVARGYTTSSDVRRAANKAAISAWLDVTLDIDPSNNEGRSGQHSSRTNKMSGGFVSRFLSQWEKTLNYGLLVPDEYFKGGIRAGQEAALNRLNVEESTLTTDAKGRTRQEVNYNPRKSIDARKAGGRENVQSTIENMANQTALYRTFQDDTAISRATLSIREGLNNFGDLGNILIPYAKTPANLTSRVAEYSPAGFTKGVIETINLLRNRTATEFQVGYGKNRHTVSAVEYQRQAVTDLGRGITGLEMIAAFALLKGLGVLIDTDSDDDDQAAMQASQGLSGIQLNVSALTRNPLMNKEGREIKDGDYLVSMSSLQPINGQMSIGSLVWDEITQENPNWAKILGWDTAINAINTIFDSPALETLANIAEDLQYADNTEGSQIAAVGQAVRNNVLSSIGSTAIPNPLRTVTRGLDNSYRDMYSGQYTLTNALNAAGIENETAQKVASAIESAVGADNISIVVSNIMASIPGLRETLPEKVTNLGETKTYTDNTALNMLNATVIPWTVSRYKSSDVTDELNSLLAAAKDESISVGFYPDRKAPTSISIDGVDQELTYAERQQYQRTYGQTFNSEMEKVLESSYYKNADTKEKAAIVADIQDYATNAAKAEYSDEVELDSSYLDINTFKEAGMSIAEYEQLKSAAQVPANDGTNGTKKFNASTEDEVTFMDEVLKLDSKEKQKAAISVFNGSDIDANESGTIDEDEAADANKKFPSAYLSIYKEVTSLSEFQNGDEDAREKYLDRARTYAMEKVKGESASSYSAESIVADVDTIKSAGMDFADYVTWTDTKSSYSTEKKEAEDKGEIYGTGGQNSIRNEFIKDLCEDDSLTTEQKETLYYTIGNYSTTTPVDFSSDSLHAIYSLESDTGKTRIAKFLKAYPNNTWEDFYRIKAEVSQVLELNDMGTKKAERQAALKALGYPASLWDILYKSDP